MLCAAAGQHGLATDGGAVGAADTGPQQFAGFAQQVCSVIFAWFSLTTLYPMQLTRRSYS
jgi:hypothetical protein